MSLDLFMNDTCPRCRKLIKLTAVEPHPTSRELAVHEFGCENCGRVITKILYVSHALRRRDQARQSMVRTFHGQY
jgi:hypothetical protein